VVTHIVIRWILRGTPGISYPGPENSRQAPELGVRPPESAKGKSGGFECGRKTAV
jgi:hypothetical protein